MTSHIPGVEVLAFLLVHDRQKTDSRTGHRLADVFCLSRTLLLSCEAKYGRACPNLLYILLLSLFLYGVC